MIDWTRVHELCDEIGAEDFGEVADLFLSEVALSIDRLESAADNPDIVAEQMHFLKGASLNLGFAALADLCKVGEKAAKAGDLSQVQPAQVRATFESSKSIFETELPGRLAA